MDFFTILLCLFPIFLFFYITHVPLPHYIADRKTLRFFELCMRVSTEYLGNVVETFFGPVARNKFLRAASGVFFLTQPKFEHLTIKEELFDNVPVRIYVPKEKKTDAAIIYIHGGGWCVWKARFYDNMVARLVKNLGCHIFSIDYRLAPEYPFPIPADDCLNASKAILSEKYKEYGVDPTKIVISGDSAGGNLAAVTALRLRDLNVTPKLKAQVLIYPVIHMFGFRTPSYMAYYTYYNGAGLLSPAAMARFELAYIGERASNENVRALLANRHIDKDLLEKAKKIGINMNLDEVEEELVNRHVDENLASAFAIKGTNPEVSPIFADTLADLPPALVQTAGYDVLRDEGILYANKLKEAGVDTTWINYPTGYHGAFNILGGEIREEMIQDITNYINKYI